MNEESPQSCPPANNKEYDAELVLNHIKLELQKKDIAAKLGKDISNKNLTVTTDKKVPEEMMLSQRKFAENKGFNVEFHRMIK